MNTWYMNYAAMVVCAMAGLAAHQWIPWKAMTHSDWGTWVGSIGTVLTLIGTIWLATSQARTKRQEALTLALVAAASIMVQLRNLVRSLAQTREMLRTPLAQPDQVAVAFANCFQTIDEVDIWNTEELVPLVYLPNQTAAKIAYTGIKVRTIKAQLKKVSEDEQSDWEAVSLFVGGLIYEIDSVLDQAGQAHSDCVFFLANHGFENAIPKYQPGFDTVNYPD